jgi:predicted ester cyclase
MGIYPTGKQITYWGISIYEIQSGKISQQWGSTDLYALLSNLRGEKPQITLSKAA